MTVSVGVLIGACIDAFMLGILATTIAFLRLRKREDHQRDLAERDHIEQLRRIYGRKELQ